MSILFGIRKHRGATASRQELFKLGAATERYALDGVSVSTQGRIGMGFQPYYTQQRSTLERLPITDIEGNMLCFDGRIDNFQELAILLGIRGEDHPDSSIFMAAFHRWGDACFSKVVGDWSVALWSAREQAVYLARDHAGARSLFFQDSAGVLRWSTYLDNLIADEMAPCLDGQFAACYLGSEPIQDLTPYKGIRSVPPARFLVVRDNGISTRQHWDSIVTSKIRYKSDEEYEEQLRKLFRQSVERRTGPGASILAQLSGGMDSSSIVCMADQIRRSANLSLIDTISHYDDTEPNWNERPYISIVESTRGKPGTHIRTSFLDRTFDPANAEEAPFPLPGPDSSMLEAERILQCHLSEKGYRSILSGVGGDEVLGGVPSPLPELADFLLSGRFNRLLRASVAWCLIDRSPLIAMLANVAKFSAGIYFGPDLDDAGIPPWITSNYREQCIERRRLLRESGTRLGASPSTISNSLTWSSVLESLPHLNHSALVRYEYRYPYLDRDLVEFLFSIPREQLVRPGRRRSLMRRALRSIVPVEILERRRKAYVIRGPLASLQRSQAKIEALFADSLAVQHGFVDAPILLAAIDTLCNKRDPKWMLALMKTIGFELWLRTRTPPLMLSLSTFQRRIRSHPPL